MKITKKSLNQLIEELLDLRAAVERCKEVEEQVKEGMRRLELDEVVTNRAKVKVSTSTRASLKPDQVRAILDLHLANRLIEVKESVKMDRVRTFHETGLIEPKQYAALDAVAKKVEITSLYVRPQ